MLNMCQHPNSDNVPLHKFSLKAAKSLIQLAARSPIDRNSEIRVELGGAARLSFSVSLTMDGAIRARRASSSWLMQLLVRRRHITSPNCGEALQRLTPVDSRHSSRFHADWKEAETADLPVGHNRRQMPHYCLRRVDPGRLQWDGSCMALPSKVVAGSDQQSPLGVHYSSCH